MAGLLNSGKPWSGLAQELRAQAPQAEWDAQGIDRADELAKMLYDKGVTSLAQMSLKKGVAYDSGGSPASYAGGDQGYNIPAVDPTHNTDGMALDFGNGLTVGNLGDRGKSSDAVLATGTDKGGLGELGWSSAGHGNVGYVVEQGADGKVQIVPKWGSSATDSLEAGRGVAAVLGAGALGASGLLGNTVGGVATAAPSAGLTAGGIESVALPTAASMTGALPEIAVGAGTGGTAAAATGGAGLLANGGTFNAAVDSQLANTVASAGGMTNAEAAAIAAKSTTAATAAGGNVISGGIKWVSDNLLTPLGLTGKDALSLVGAGISNINANKNAQAQRDFTAAENQKARDAITARDQAGWAHDAQLQADKFKRMTPTGGLLSPYLQRN